MTWGSRAEPDSTEQQGPHAARALSFGPAAAAYERYRLGYPPGLVDAILAYAARPVRTALEIGAGTGKATRAFAGAGIRVTASDPSAQMLDELRRHLDVETVQAALEDLPAASYDLVYAAASLHWTEPVGRWPRIAALLVPGGTFATFGGRARLSDPRVEHAVARARAPWLAEDELPAPAIGARTADGEDRWVDEMEASGLFR